LQGVQGSSGITVVDDTTTNATRYIVFEDQTSGVSDTNYVSSTKFAFNPLSGNVGIGLTNPTEKLDISGNLKVSGSITGSSSFTLPKGKGIKWNNPAINEDVEVINDVSLYLSGISTFVDGPVLIGSGNSTTTAEQRLQVTGGTYISGNLGIGNTNSTSKLGVVGDGLFTGVVTSTTFIGQVSSGVGTITNLSSTNGTITIINSTSGIITNLSGTIGTITTLNSTNGTITNLSGTIGTVTTLNSTTGTVTNLSGTQLSYSGVSTFSNGPVLIGSGTSTGTLTQRLQVTGNAYISGNLGIGTTNPTQELDIANDMRLRGGLYDSNNIVGTAGSVLTSTGIGVSWAPAGSGAGLAARTIVTGITTQLVSNGIGNTDITGFKTYGLLKVGVSTAAWIRLYTDSTSRTNDALRSIEVDPDSGSGVLAEVITAGISTVKITPFVVGFNDDSPATNVIYASVKNLSGISTSITIDLTILQLEG
jgi:hypothetical protein